MIFGVQIKAARVLLKMSQSELARVSGVSIPTLQNIENNDDKLQSASVSTISKIQEALESRGIRFLAAKEKDSMNGVGVRISLETDK